MNRILIVRTDRLGDVLLTTPVSTALRAAFPEAEISWLVRPYTAPLLELNPDVDHILLDRGESIAALAILIKSKRFDAVIVAYPRWRVVWALWRAGVPLRIGPASKPYSFLLNRLVWQHRSEGKKHEADYNLELLEPLGISFKRWPTRFVLAEEERKAAKKVLESHRISFTKPIVILHPGSGGSSARWPLQHFMQLGDKLQAAGCDVVVTGGPGENYQYLMIDNMHRIPVFIAAGSVSIRELAGIFSCADLLISNSTGPLHLGVSLDVPTISVYSPLPSCHPQRWGPYPDFVEGKNEHQVVVAPLRAGTAQAQDDMAAVSVEEVWDLCQATVSRKAARAGSTKA